VFCRPCGFCRVTVVQKEIRAFSWTALGPIEVEVIAAARVGVPVESKATPAFGLEKLG
jgi:hypothetical protein